MHKQYSDRPISDQVYCQAHLLSTTSGNQKRLLAGLLTSLSTAEEGEPAAGAEDLAKGRAKPVLPWWIRAFSNLS